MGVIDSFHGVRHTARISAATLLDAATGRLTADRADARLAWWSRRLLEDAEATLEVHGSELVPEHGSFVVMSNHRSYYDIPTVFCAIPGRVRMVAKKELFRVPVFGRAMLASGFVRIDRQDRTRAIESLEQSRQMIADGIRVWIAPEGTRSVDGRLGPFKSGGFHLALAAGVPIVPVAITGTENILAHDSRIVHKGAHVTARILPPVDTASYGASERKQLTADVRRAIAEALGETP